MTDSDEPRPVYGEPELDPGWDDDGEPVNITDFGWDLAWGCKLSFGRPDPGVEGGPLHVTVSTSDKHQADGITVRTVTGKQLIAFGRMAIALGEAAL